MRIRIASTLIVLCALSSSALAHFTGGQVWLADYTNNKVYRVNVVTGQVIQSLDAGAGLNGPGAIGFSHHGHMLVANFDNSTVQEFEPDLSGSTVLTAGDGISGPFGGNSVVMGPGEGDVYISNLTTQEVVRYTDEYEYVGVVLDASDGLVLAAGMGFLPDGDLLVANRGGNGEIFHVTPEGVVTTYATMPVGINPAGLVVRNNGDVYVVSTRGQIYRMIGGDPNNMVLLGEYGSGVANQCIAFQQTFSTLYHVAASDGIFHKIDPDTGASINFTVVPGSPNAMVCVGSHYPFGSFIEVGESLAGTDDFEPLLSATGEPRTGEAATIEINDFVGGAPLFLFTSPFAEDIDLFGGEFHIKFGAGLSIIEFAAGGTPGVGGEGDLSIPFTMPNLPGLVGLKIFTQVLAPDAEAIEGVAMTNSMTMYIGE